MEDGIDFRALNEKTIRGAYPFPNITEILVQLGSVKYFSIRYRVRISSNTDAWVWCKKTAFFTSHRHYHFNRMLFGLKNAPATFQRFIDQILSGLERSDMLFYLDIVIYASPLTEHQTKFNKFAKRLGQANLKTRQLWVFAKRSKLSRICDRQRWKPDSLKVL